MHTRHKSSHIDSLRAVGKSTGKRKSKPGCLIFASKLGEDLRGAANSKPHNRPSVSEKSQHSDPRKKNSLSLYLYLSRSLKKVRRKYVEKNIERKRCAVDYKTLRGKLAACWTPPSAGPIGTGEGSCGEA